jgi:hypothetical protein
MIGPSSGHLMDCLATRRAGAPASAQSPSAAAVVSPGEQFDQRGDVEGGRLPGTGLLPVANGRVVSG